MKHHLIMIRYPEMNNVDRTNRNASFWSKFLHTTLCGLNSVQILALGDLNFPPPPAPGGKQYYCEVCDKQLNGPKPYQAHMSSKAHREELALLEEK